MSGPDLAPRGTSKHSSCSENPFASPFITTHTATATPPCAQTPYDPRNPRTSIVVESLSSPHANSTYYPADVEYKSGSLSSTLAGSIMTPTSSIDLEKAKSSKEEPPKRISRESKRSGASRDPEKAVHHGSRHGSHQSTRAVEKKVVLEDEEEELATALQEQKAVKIILFMSGPCVILSSVNTVWAIIALFITTLSQPIRICARRPTFGQQLAGLLGPTLNLQLRSIYTPLPPHANEDGSYHNGMLLAVHLLSPFLSFAVMFAAWVLAIYWLASGMVGDPAGQDKRDDGKETVLKLRSFWEKWLMGSMKEE